MSRSKAKLRHKQKHGVFGLNVYHAIKKPKLKPKATSPKSSPASKKHATTEAGSTSSPHTPRTPKTPKTPKSSAQQSLFKISPGRVGSLSPSVMYVLRNGQYQFIRRSAAMRRSPVKEMASSEPVRRSPRKQLVQCRQSPVKFQAVSHEADEEAETDNVNRDVLGLIDALEDDEVEVGNNHEDQGIASSNQYAVFVDNGDDLARIAWNAVHEIEELSLGEDGLTQDSNCTDVSVTEGNYSDNSRLVFECSPAKMEPEPYNSSDKFTSCESPSKKTTGKENVENPLVVTPRKSERIAKATPPKVFPIFQRGAKSGHNAPSSPQKHRRAFTSLQKDASGLQQTIIDAGQKQIGSQHCSDCNFFYLPGDAKEERLHEAHHNKEYRGVIPYPSWKNEQVVREDVIACEWKIVCVDPSNKAQWRKAEEVVAIVDSFLGVNNGIRQSKNSQAYLLVIDKRVGGLLLAEPLLPGDRLSRSCLDERTATRLVSEDLDKNTKHMCGISRIWVHADYQREGHATNLVNALRSHFRKPLYLDIDYLAFSHTTEMGSSFASAYMKTNCGGAGDFLLYRPSTS